MAEEVEVVEAEEEAVAEAATEEAPVAEAEESVAPPTDKTFYGSAAGQSEFSDSLSPRSESSEPLKEVEGGRPYEISYISRVGDAEATEATSQRLNDLVDGFGGAIDNVRSSEARRLAYPIKREVEGIYIVVNTRIQPVHLPEVDRFFKLEESVIRHMIIREN